jgi:hypothetical protein
MEFEAWVEIFGVKINPGNKSGGDTRKRRQPVKGVLSCKLLLWIDD